MKMDFFISLGSKAAVSDDFFFCGGAGYDKIVKKDLTSFLSTLYGLCKNTSAL